MNDKKRTEVSNKLMDASRCVSKDNIGCILNDALHGEKKLSGVNENCSVCCSVLLVELADLIKPSYDRDALLALTDEMNAYTKCDDERCGREMPPRVIHDIARRIRDALGVGR